MSSFMLFLICASYCTLSENRMIHMHRQVEIKNLLLATDTLTDAERATCNGRWTVSPKPSGGGKA